MAVPERISLALCENLLTLLSQNDQQGRVVASIIDPNLFEGDMRTIAERCIQYWRSQHEAPKTHTSDLFADIIEDKHNRRGANFRRILTSMQDLAEAGVNTNYVLQQLRLFTRLQKLKDAILKAAQQLNQPGETTVQEVEDILANILRARDFQFDPGLRLHHYETLIKYLETHYSEFDTGIKELDDNQVVPTRGTVFLILGGAGRGKTWGMVHLGKRAYMMRKKVVHVTPEVGGEEVMQRYYQSILSMAKRAEAVKVMRLATEQEGPGNRFRKLVGLEREMVEPTFGLNSKFWKDDLKFNVEQHQTRMENIIIKRVAPRAMSIHGLRGYLDSLENAEGFTPDMLILDSIYLMQPEAGIKERRIALGGIVEDFRALCIDRNIAGVCSHQLSREGAKALRGSMMHVGEDWSIAQTADIVVTFSATDTEQAFGLGRLYADKVRTDRGHFGVLVTQSYDLGQFVLESFPLPADYWDFVDQLAPGASEEEDQEDAEVEED